MKKDEIKAGELKIGNYFIDTFTKEPIQLTGSDIGVMEYKDSCRKMHESIPLTEQWLKDFGFKQIGKYEPWKLNSKGFNIEFDMNGSIVGCYLEKVGIDILYVHQLQNLYFALIRKELTLIK